MNLLFTKAELVVRHGFHLSHASAHNVSLVIHEENKKNKRIRSRFLNGELKIEGTLFESCLPCKSIANPGTVANLKLIKGNTWTLVQIVFVKLLDVASPEHGQRTYKWLFFVVGVTNDPLVLFPVIEDEEVFVDIDELLDMLGAERKELGGVKFDGEGSFHQ